ncbi:hypothetical protein BCR35DRAFT_302441 [Leucosporidium creatinivorum]|uniref:Uncharacterized protein n=1 Tax=Leucosporidium creatinivorum TaxID=106004 RepID=A0A1Y2FTU3_9BASI|nr:hypothetical protein BCR35DRAFT_302441 [Leucosporidium creatinivorum]
MLSLLLVCKSFYVHLLPRFYAQPVLVNFEALALFAERCSAQPILHASTLAGLVKKFVLHPGSAHPTEEWVQAWKTHLPTILPQLSALQSFVPGILTLHLSMDEVASLLPSNNRITSLDQLDHYASLYVDTSGPLAEQVHPSLSLMAHCPSLKRLSMSGLNLLEKGYGMQQSSRALLMDEEEGEWRVSDSVADRFLRCLKLGVAFGPDGEQGGGLESLLLWENSVMGVGVLKEVLECLPKLRW